MPSIYSIAFKALLISAATSHLAAAYPTGGDVIYDSNGDNPGSLQTPEVSINNNAIQLENGDTVKLDKPALNNRDVSIDGNFKYDGSDGSLETSEVSIDDNVVRLSNGNTVKLDKPVINNRGVNDEDEDDKNDYEEDGGNVLYDSDSGSLETSNVSINDNVIRTKNGDTVKLDKPVLDSRDENNDQNEDEDEDKVYLDEVDEDEDEDGDAERQ